MARKPTRWFPQPRRIPALTAFSASKTRKDAWRGGARLLADAVEGVAEGKVVGYKVVGCAIEWVREMRVSTAARSGCS